MEHTPLPSLLKRLRQVLETLYGARLDRVVLYGSHARSEAAPGADVDVMVVLRGSVDTWEEIDHLAEAIYAVEQGNDLLIALYPISASEYETSRLLFLADIRREGVTI